MQDSNLKSPPKEREADRLMIRLRWDDTLEELEKATVEIVPVHSNIPLNGKKGKYTFEIEKQGYINIHLEDLIKDVKSPLFHLIVKNGAGHVLYQSDVLDIRRRSSQVFDILLPAAEREGNPVRKPSVLIGDIEVNAEALAKLEPEDILTIARAIIDPKVAESAKDKITNLSPHLYPGHKEKVWICETPILRTIEEIIIRKKWPR